MFRSLTRYVAVMGLLLLGGAAALVALTRPAPAPPVPTPPPGSVPPATQRAATSAPLDFVFIQDVDGWLRTPDEAAVTTPYDLRVGPAIESLPLTLGDWTGVDEVADRDFVMG
ncbi:MAG: hypothetical protein KJ734_10020, partial [Chloroflexi bacterium]|nr:hypothetical protein [Chloroflexota bacterium]